MPNHILITSAGRRVELVRAFQQSLKSYFNDAAIFTTDLKPELSAACQVANKSFKIARVTDPNYIEDLLYLCINNNIRLIIPTIDTELKVLAVNKNRFAEHNIQIVVSDINFINICRDKRLTKSFFDQRSVPTPKEISKSTPTFPLFIKPYDGSLSVDTFVVRTPNDLTEYHKINPRLIFMEFMDSEWYDEYSVDMYFDKNGVPKCIVPRKRIEVRSGEINKGVTHKNEIVPFLFEKLSHIEGAIGCLTLQLFLHKITKKIICFEINPRFGGGYPLSYAAGANYPKWIIEEYLLNNSIEKFMDWEENLLMLRYDSHILVQDYDKN